MRKITTVFSMHMKILTWSQIVFRNFRLEIVVDPWYASIRWPGAKLHSGGIRGEISGCDGNLFVIGIYRNVTRFRPRAPADSSYLTTRSIGLQCGNNIGLHVVAPNIITIVSFFFLFFFHQAFITQKCLIKLPPLN